MAGRLPKSEEAHKQNGTYRQSRHGGRGFEHDKTVSLPAPQSLSDKSKKWWDIIVPFACKSGMMAEADALVLEQAFLEWERAVKYRELAQNAQNENDVFNTIKFDREATYHMQNALKIFYKYGVTPQENLRIKGGGNSKQDEKKDAVMAIIGQG